MGKESLLVVDIFDDAKKYQFHLHICRASVGLVCRRRALDVRFCKTEWTDKMCVGSRSFRISTG